MARAAELKTTIPAANLAGKNTVAADRLEFYTRRFPVWPSFICYLRKGLTNGATRSFAFSAQSELLSIQSLA
jgi:hypothetical protein